jgi:hypothetical protein
MSERNDLFPAEGGLTAINGGKTGRVKRGKDVPTVDVRSWEGYDPEAIYPRSQDSHGHSVNAQVPLPKDIAGAIHGAIEGHPEMTYIGDFIRTATIHYLHWWTERTDEERAAAIRAAMSREESRQRAARYKAQEQAVRELAEACGVYARAEEYAMVGEEIKNAREWAVEMPMSIQKEVEKVAEKFEYELRKAQDGG